MNKKILRILSLFMLICFCVSFSSDIKKEYKRLEDYKSDFISEYKKNRALSPERHIILEKEMGKILKGITEEESLVKQNEFINFISFGYDTYFLENSFLILDGKFFNSMPYLTPGLFILTNEVQRAQFSQETWFKFFVGKNEEESYQKQRKIINIANEDAKKRRANGVALYIDINILDSFPHLNPVLFLLIGNIVNLKSTTIEKFFIGKTKEESIKRQNEIIGFYELTLARDGRNAGNSSYYKRSSINFITVDQIKDLNVHFLIPEFVNFLSDDCKKYVADEEKDRKENLQKIENSLKSSNEWNDGYKDLLENISNNELKENIEKIKERLNKQKSDNSQSLNQQNNSPFWSIKKK